MDFESYLRHVDQPVVILDKLHQAAAMNPAFARLFPQVALRENLFAFTATYPMLKPLLSCGEGVWPVQVGGRHYNAHVSFARHGPRRRLVGRCILFTDITDTVDLLAETERQARMLQASSTEIQRQNEALAASIQMEREAAALRERALLLRDIHDTLGHTLTMLGALHQLALAALPNTAAARAQLAEVLRMTNISIAELEAAGNYESGSFVDFLHRFRASMARVGLEIALEIEGQELPEHRYMYADLMRICQEAATNAVRHGNASRLQVRLAMRPHSLHLLMQDNGRAQKPMGQGHGLRSMDERVNNLFGDFAYGQTPEGGFYVRVDAPVIREEETGSP